MNTKTETSPLIGGWTIEQWNNEWMNVPGGFAVPHPELRGKAGLFRANMNGETMVIGKAAGSWPNRLAKRLSDFRRPSSSARCHPTGMYIHDNIDLLTLQVLVIGSDLAACALTNRLVRPMIAFHKPHVNVPLRIVENAAFGYVVRDSQCSR